MKCWVKKVASVSARAHTLCLCTHLPVFTTVFLFKCMCKRAMEDGNNQSEKVCVCVCEWVRETKTVLGHSCQCSCVASCKLKCLHGLMETLRGDKDGKVPEIFNWLFAPMTFISLCSSFSLLCLNPMWRKNLGFAKQTSKEKNIKMCEYAFLQADI